jgi:hypothetical protein
MGLNDTVVLVLIFVAVLGLLWYLNKKGAISNEGEMFVPSIREHLTNEEAQNAVNETTSTPALSAPAVQGTLQDGNWEDQFSSRLTGSRTDVVPTLDNTQNVPSSFNNLDATNLAGVTNDEVDKIVNERAQKQLEFNNTDLLPQEVNKDWFESDFSNARIKIGNDNLINTDRYMVGINTVGQSLKNPSYDLRPSPPCPKVTVSPWNQSTIEPDFNIKPWY